MWREFIYCIDSFPIHDCFYHVTGGHHKQNQKKIRRMRRQGCKV